MILATNSRDPQILSWRPKSCRPIRGSQNPKLPAAESRRREREECAEYSAHNARRMTLGPTIRVSGLTGAGMHGQCGESEGTEPRVCETVLG
ncbi:hypothetical protein J6590_016573 [Homalodisca vitripennis]|nr:hypothetical protein J6590_016573 [Homalodisca vitripennis]